MASPQGTDRQTEQPPLTITGLGLKSGGRRKEVTRRILNIIGSPAYDVMRVCRKFYEWQFFYPDLVVKVALKLCNYGTTPAEVKHAVPRVFALDEHRRRALLQSDLRCLRWILILRKKTGEDAFGVQTPTVMRAFGMPSSTVATL